MLSIFQGGVDLDDLDLDGAHTALRLLPRARSTFIPLHTLPPTSSCPSLAITHGQSTPVRSFAIGLVENHRIGTACAFAYTSALAKQA